MGTRETRVSGDYTSNAKISGPFDGISSSDESPPDTQVYSIPVFDQSTLIYVFVASRVWGADDN